MTFACLLRQYQVAHRQTRPATPSSLFRILPEGSLQLSYIDTRPPGSDPFGLKVKKVTDRQSEILQATQLADASLEHARSLPPGPSRYAAFRVAGRLRNAAERLREEMDAPLHCGRSRYQDLGSFSVERKAT
jgi:hypothetical protein